MLPQTPSGLARRVAELGTRTRPLGAGVRLGLDGPVRVDAETLADAVATVLEELAVPVARVRSEHFLRARSLRLEYGPDDPAAFFDRWHDWPALRREVLDPLGPGGSGRWLPRLRDPGTDRPFRDPYRSAPPGLVVVVDGPFLARPELAGAFDVLAFLDVSPAARARRVPAAEQARVLPAWERYLSEHDPAGRATVVVRHDHPARPALARTPCPRDLDR